jgi:putative transposase
LRLAKVRITLDAMTHLLPIVRAGGWYHVINRGVNGSALFPTPAAATAFVLRLGEIAMRFGIEIHAYCVMGNHYHLLARAPEDELLRAIVILEAGLSENIGRVRLRRLALGRHLLQVTRYIHRNPMEAGLAQWPADWPWSSYRGYLDGLDGPYWLRSRSVLGWLGSIGVRLQYRLYVEFDRQPTINEIYR